MRWVEMTCLECKQVRRVRLFELDRARKPHCLHCGGALEISENARGRMADVNDAKKGRSQKRPPKEEPVPRLIPVHEARRYDFWQHPDIYGWCKRDMERRGQKIPEEMTASLFYNAQGEMFRNTIRHTSSEERWATALIHLAEGKLYSSGRPYYKVWPSITSMLMDTEICIPGANFHLPFEGIEIRFPKEDNPMWPICAAVACRLDNNDLAYNDRDWSFVVFYFDNVPEYDLKDDSGKYHIADIPIRANMLLEDSLDQTKLLQETENPDQVRQLVRICVGICFFGLDQHELILPDLKRKTVQQFISQRRQPTPSEATRALADAKKAGLFGFRVGSEIDLPRPNVIRTERSSAPDGEHRELTFSHIRRGHLAYVLCGEGRQERKLIFRHPTLVRPDLPLQSSHGYRVRKPGK